MTAAEVRNLRVGDRVVWRSHGGRVGTVAAITNGMVDIVFDGGPILTVPFGSEEWLNLDVDVSGRRERGQ